MVCGVRGGYGLASQLAPFLMERRKGRNLRAAIPSPA